jgi:hypothetical protein
MAQSSAKVKFLKTVPFLTSWRPADAWGWATFRLRSDLWIVVECTKLYNPATYYTVQSLSCLQGFPTKWRFDLDLWSWKTIGFFLLRRWSSVRSYMILQRTVRSLSGLKGFPTKYASTFTFDLEKQKVSSSYYGDLVYQVVWSCDLRSGLSCLQLFLLGEATTLTLTKQ